MDNETRCSLVRDLLPGYVEGLTGQATNAFINDHLTGCAECRAAHRAMIGSKTPDEIQTEALVQTLRSHRRRRIRRGWAAVTALLIVLAVCLLPLPRSIHREYDALEWRCGDAEYSVKRSVRIDGTYFNYLFRTDTFQGSIVIEGHPQSERPMSHCQFVDGLANLWYQNEKSLMQCHGMLLMEPDGSGFQICLYEDGGWNGADGLMLTSNAASRADAVDKANALAKKLNPSFLGSEDVNDFY